METIDQTTETPYQRIGGEAAIRKLVDRFYQLMDELPEAYTARKIHPQDLTESGNKFVDFLSGWLGGPQLYVEKYGPPMLRRRHMPYAIGPEERDQWLMCMKLALAEIRGKLGTPGASRRAAQIACDMLIRDRALFIPGGSK